MSGTALIVAHQWHQSAPQAAQRVNDLLHAAGWTTVTEQDDNGHSADIAIVLGGDGTFLKAADIVRGRSIPLLGINLGHVGFLTEADLGDLDVALEAVTTGHFRIEERATISLHTLAPDGETNEGWALNEAAIEKVGPGRMLEIALEVDGRPISTFGCDGVVIATPSGSTAHAFSAGGPVIWPDVDAMVIAPLAAHALFARPLVVSPRTMVAVEILARSLTPALISLDGRRTISVPAGGRIEVRRAPETVKLVRLGQAPFADRLVHKFALPVAGWRGGQAARA